MINSSFYQKQRFNHKLGMLFSLFFSTRWSLRLAFFYSLCCINVVNADTSDSGNNNQNALMQAMFAKAFGKKADVPSESNADLRINNVNYEQQVIVYSNEEKIIDQVEVKTLLIVLADVLTDDFLQKITPTLQKNKKISFAQLSELGIKTRYNSADLSLDIDIDPDLQKPRTLSLQHQSNAILRASKQLQPDDVGGYVNLYSNLTTSAALPKPTLRLLLEGSLNIHGYVFEGTASQNGDQWTIGNMLLTYDRPDKLYRYQAGDIAMLTKGFQDNYSLKGISLNKNFFFDPKLQIKPLANSTFTLTSDSEVEVYINKKLQKRFQLVAGRYTLEDIGLQDGANNIDIKIKDAFGKITHKTTKEYYDTRLLKPDLSTFSTSFGILDDAQEEMSTPLAQQLVFSGYYQQGLYQNLTLGVDVQLNHERQLLGSEIITSNKAGRFKFNIGLSHRKKGNIGAAIRFTYQPDIKDMLHDSKLDEFIRAMSFRGEYRSPYFDQLSTSSTTNNTPFLQAKLQSNIAFHLGERWEAGLSMGFCRNYHESNEYTATARLSKRFRHGIKWSISAEYQTSNNSSEDNADNDLRIQTQLRIPLSRKIFSRQQDAAFDYDSRSSRLTGVYNIRRLAEVGKNSLGGEVKYIQDDNNQAINTSLNYRHQRFESRLTTQHSSLSQQLNINLNSGLLCAGSNCSLSYPVNDSFALVKGPATQDKPIAIKNGFGKFNYPDNTDSDLPDNYSALINDKDSPAVILLDSYKYQRISIDEGGLPFGYDPEKTEFEFIPRYHSSFTLIAGGKPGTVVTGKLIDQDNNGMGFKGGQWKSVQENGKIIAFFTNKTGRFHLPSVPIGTYNIELFDHPTMKAIQVDIPDKQGEIHSIGELVVIEKP